MLYRIIFISLVLGGSLPGVGQSKLTCGKVVQFKKLLDTHHVEPRIWDNDFAVQVTERTFTLLDPMALFFNRDEIQLFTAKADKLNSALLAGDCTFLSELKPRYEHALNRAERLLGELRNAPIDFTVNDTLVYNFRGNSFLTTDAELKKRWLQLVKFSVLAELANTKENAKLLPTKYKPAAEKAYAKYLNMITRRKEVDGGMENLLLNKLLNAIAHTYDPHTQYYDENEKQSLLDMVSLEQFSFGFLLEDDPMGNAVIARVIPGSSAWDIKRIDVGDVVTGIGSAHMKKVDASLYSSDELHEMLGSISNEVELSVRKSDGGEVTFKLIKQKLREDDNKIKSLIISDSKHRLGYIDLPIFFSKDDVTETGCATELAKEILQLKKANVQGIILDIRNNGGGDLQEALDLAGIFIDRGALAIMKNKTEEPETLKDSNLGTAYDGPLVVMINGASASASEFFAAAMRDHNRAILIGGTTYGKGTGQSSMFFDATQREMVKITTIRFYGVKGTSNQGKGIPPDINLPDRLSELDYSESSELNVLAANRIQKKTYYTPLPPLPIDLLRDSSNQRVARNSFFRNLEAKQKERNVYRKGSQITVPLTVSGFLEMTNRQQNNAGNLTPVSDRYTIKLTAFDQQVTGVDNFGQETYKNLVEDVSHDFYIDEAIHILVDYIQLKNK